jgi:hypothetical protein
MSRADTLRGAMDAVESALKRGGEADDLLRHVTTILHERAGYSWTAIRFVENDQLVLGPSAGDQPEATHSLPVAYGGRPVARLEVGPAVVDSEDDAFLQRVAALVSPYCLVGWDTHGERWEP